MKICSGQERLIDWVPHASFGVKAGRLDVERDICVFERGSDARAPHLEMDKPGAKLVVRVTLVTVIIASVVSACSGTLKQLSPMAAAQHNYDDALAAYQNCYNANSSNRAACEKESQNLDASTKVLANELTAER